MQTSKIFLEQSQSKNYNPDLLNLFLSVSSRSGVAYITSVVLFSWIFFDYIPLHIFILIVGAHILYQVIRLIYVRKYTDTICTEKEKIEFVRQHTALMLFGSVIWGLSCYIVAFYSPPNYEYIMLFFVIAISSGSISTLSPIYRIYLAFNLPMIIILILTFLYIQSEFYLYIIIALPIFSFVQMSAAWEMHKSLKRSVELKDLYAQSQEELTEVNSSLEERVEQAVEENRQKDQQMLAQSRLAQMGEMISMIAHQWRQPLSAIAATTGSMTLHIQLEDLKKEYIEENIDKINTYTQYLSTTINDFRDFFKPNKQKENIALDDIVLGSLQIMGSSLKAEDVEVETFLDSSEKIYTYSNEIKQVVLNLLKNAKDIYAEKKIDNAKIVIKTYSDDRYVILEVYDNAGGVSLDHLPYIFDPYFTTKQKRDGTGLGLYMSKLIIEDHCDGFLRIKNESDGACFSLTLPKD